MTTNREEVKRHIETTMQLAPATEDSPKRKKKLLVSFQNSNRGQGAGKNPKPPESTPIASGAGSEKPKAETQKPSF